MELRSNFFVRCVVALPALIAAVGTGERLAPVGGRDIMTYFLRFSLPYILQNHSPDPFQLLPGLAAAFHREHLHDAGGGPGSAGLKRRQPLIVDVGAWAGDVSAQLLQLFTDIERKRYHGDDYDQAVPVVLRRREALSVLAFEPDPETFQRLTARAEAHQWARVGFCAVEAALSHSVRGPQQFRTRKGFSQDSQLEEENEGVDEELNGEPIVTVDVFSLDSWLLDSATVAGQRSACALAPLHAGDGASDGKLVAEVFLLKVDAQGHDDQVLRGAERLLRANLVRFVIFEYGGHGAVPSEDRSLWAMVQFLWEHGMACFLVFELLLVPVSGPWWMDPYDAAGGGGGHLGLQSSDLFCGGVHDPGLQLIIELFVGSRYAPRAKEFVLHALRELRNLHKSKSPGQLHIVTSVAEKHREHIARVETGYWDLSMASRESPEWDLETFRDMRMRACLELGDLFAHGYGAPANYSAAKEWFSRAASEGSSDALINIGIIEHFHGRGTVERRRQFGGEMYLKASAAGHAFAGLISLPVFA